MSNEQQFSLTIKVPSKNVILKSGKLIKPLKKKQLVEAIAKELQKEKDIKNIESLGVYPFDLRLWIVRSDDID